MLILGFNRLLLSCYIPPPAIWGQKNDNNNKNKQTKNHHLKVKQQSNHQTAVQMTNMSSLISPLTHGNRNTSKMPLQAVFFSETQILWFPSHFHHTSATSQINSVHNSCLITGKKERPSFCKLCSLYIHLTNQNTKTGFCTCDEKAPNRECRATFSAVQLNKLFGSYFKRFI